MIYSERNKNNSETAREFRCQHLNLPEISLTFVYRVMRGLGTSSFHIKLGPGRKCLHTEAQEIDIITYLSAYSHISIRKASAIMELSRTSINRMIMMCQNGKFSVNFL